MNQDKEHLKLLSIFTYVHAALTALFACIPIIHVIIGAMFIAAPEQMGSGSNPPPPGLGWMFVIIGSSVILLGWAFAAVQVWAARSISQNRNWLLCLVVAGIIGMNVPIGTMLGVFTFVVLLKPEVKKLFEETPIIGLPDRNYE